MKGEKMNLEEQVIKENFSKLKGSMILSLMKEGTAEYFIKYGRYDKNFAIETDKGTLFFDDTILDTDTFNELEEMIGEVLTDCIFLSREVETNKEFHIWTGYTTYNFETSNNKCSLNFVKSVRGTKGGAIYPTIVGSRFYTEKEMLQFGIKKDITQLEYNFEIELVNAILENDVEGITELNKVFWTYGINSDIYKVPFTEENLQKIIALNRISKDRTYQVALELRQIAATNYFQRTGNYPTLK